MAGRPATVDVPRLSFSLREAGAILGLGHETVRRMILGGDLPARRVGRRYLIPRAALEPFGQVPTSRVERGAGGGPFEPNAGAAPSALAAGAPAVVADAVPSSGPSSTEQTPDGSHPSGVR